MATAPLSAKSLTVRMGETWLFAVRQGAPVDARKVTPTTAPAPGQFKVSLQPLFGSTMTIANNSRFDYAYRATLILPTGKPGVAKSCAVPANGRIAIEQWTKAVAAVRLDRFKPAPAGALCP
ncbi:hypothetical protein [Sphingomonas sp.]|uniref:hypothetical protein n=1 Tax=Sphingomonas sp. TaxID=28214 RepID=UPI00286CDF7A|nr:hypothetical protein [Sphingomonas sp.]